MIRRWLLPAVVMAAAVGYTLTTPACVLGGDNGEFATLFATGGIAHPPGYPAMVLWLRALRWIPASTPAKGAALATVPLAVLTVWLLQRACLAWGASDGATALASAIFAFSPLAWKLGCHAEVFAMNAAIAAAILWLAAPDAPPLRGHARLVALGVLAGCGLADNQTIVLVAPAGLLAAWRARREADSWWALLGGFGACAATACLFYLYVYVVARTADPRSTFMWIESPSLAGVWFHVRRGAYGMLMETKVGGTLGASLAWRNASRMLTASTLHLLCLPAAAAVAPLVWRLRRVRTHTAPERVPALVALATTVVVAGPLFAACLNLRPGGAAPTVVERFYLLPEVVLTLAGALALDGLMPTLTSRPGLMALFTGLAAPVATVLAVPEVLEHNRPTVELYLRNTLRSAPPGSILIGTGDHRFFGFAYTKLALGLRPDVTFVTPPILVQRWYRDLVHEETGADPTAPDGRPVDPTTLIVRLLATGRRVSLTDWYQSEPLTAFPHYTEGTLVRIFPPGTMLPELDAIEQKNVDTFAGYTLERTLPEDPDGWGYQVMSDYARPWLALAYAFARQHDVDRAAACAARAAAFTPWDVGLAGLPRP